jgi:hypothetical protein
MLFSEVFGASCSGPTTLAIGNYPDFPPKLDLPSDVLKALNWTLTVQAFRSRRFCARSFQVANVEFCHMRILGDIAATDRASRR